jgi:hypothetical protein
LTDEKILTKKTVPIIVIAWVLSLFTTLAIVYVAPNIFPPLKSDNIADEAILTTKLADGSVTSHKILDGTITAVDLADGSIITVKVANGAITTEKIADKSITTDKIADNAIITIKMADGSVNSAKILDGSVTTVDLANGAVTSMKISDGAVTARKLSDNAIPLWTLTTAIPQTIKSTDWIDMQGAAVNIVLERNSKLLVFYSSSFNSDGVAEMRVMVDSWSCLPYSVYLCQIENPGWAGFAVQTFVFHGHAPAGTHIVKVQWRLFHTLTTFATVGNVCLYVLALPA